jgi:hypothetical protein
MTAAGSDAGGASGPALRCVQEERRGEWIAKRNVTVPAAFGMVEIKAGQPADEELQERLDVQCK